MIPIRLSIESLLVFWKVYLSSYARKNYTETGLTKKSPLVSQSCFMNKCLEVKKLEEGLCNGQSCDSYQQQVRRISVI